MIYVVEATGIVRCEEMSPSLGLWSGSNSHDFAILALKSSLWRLWWNTLSVDSVRRFVSPHYDALRLHLGAKRSGGILRCPVNASAVSANFMKFLKKIRGH